MEIVMTAQGRSAAQMRRTMTTVVVLEPGEVYRLPASCEHFYVAGGIAWLTDAAGDHIVWSGDSASPFVRGDIAAIVGGLNEDPLVLEFAGAADGVATPLPPLARTAWVRRLRRILTAARKES